jgi:alpha-maltose-1-phosphate synthase
MKGAAIWYRRDAYAIEPLKPMGRQSAGASFLRGWIRHAGLSTWHCLAPDKGQARSFAATVQSILPGAEIDWVPPDRPAALAEPGCLFFPAPGLGAFAWQRRAVGQRAFSLCGITHTIASERAMDEIAESLTAPVQPWDAVICTSGPVRAAVEAFLVPQAEHLATRFGGRPPTLPRFPVIPLGVDTGAFTPDPARRVVARARLGIAPDAVVALFVGRLSFHAKAHPFPMYAALEEATRHTRIPVHLIQYGRFSTDFIANAFTEGAARWCPSVTASVLDGQDFALGEDAWAAADFFVSLSDNIQESFGLTPVEAMAAGLPCVVSDWDGYKDTVRDGIDGFRVPTVAPPRGLGTDMALRFAAEIDTYDRYIGRAGAFTAVDVPATAAALARLIADPDLRARMGAAGRRRAQETFDWRVIIPQYLSLFADLAEIRRTAPEIAPPADPVHGNLSRPDPFGMFAAYPTHALGLGTVVTARPAGTPEGLARVLADPLATLALDLLPPRDDLLLVLALLGTMGRATVGDLVMRVPEARRPLLARALVFLAKFDLLALAPPPGG